MSDTPKRPPPFDLQRRQGRLAQQRHRSSAVSYVTEWENTLVLLAWEAGELSEGQVSKLLGVHRIEARGMRIAAIERGREIGRTMWSAMRQKETPQ